MLNMGEKMSAEEIDEMIKEVDVDNSGMVSMDQFIRVVLSK